MVGAQLMMMGGRLVARRLGSRTVDIRWLHTVHGEIVPLFDLVAGLDCWRR
jgi:hypothetical protein